MTTIARVCDPRHMLSGKRNVDSVYMTMSVNYAMKLARLALGNFWLKRIQPYLILPGPIEIDETQVGDKTRFFYGRG